MLSSFRRGLMAKLMLGVLFLTLVAMVITGFGTGGGGLGDLGGLRGGNVASVEGEKLTSERLRDETQRQFERVRRESPESTWAAFLRRGSIEDNCSTS